MAEPNKVPTTEWLLPPMRGEKRVFPIPVTLKELPFDGVDGGATTYNRVTGKKTITGLDFDQSMVAKASNLAAGLTDYIYIKLKDRGLGLGEDAIFKFLVNPETIQVNRQVVDAEALTRAGMQTGIWGDLLDITIAGVTAGQYFAGVLVDEFSDYCASNRNLMELVSVYENNGAWFEGEVGSFPGALAAPAARKQIQMQADVVLVFGNFIWNGCFTSLSVDDSADTPYYNKFSLSFMAWRERFKSTSPWQNSIPANPTDEYRGHAYELYQKRAKRPQPPSLTTNKLAASSAPSLFNAGAFTPSAAFGDIVTSPNTSLLSGGSLFGANPFSGGK